MQIIVQLGYFKNMKRLTALIFCLICTSCSPGGSNQSLEVETAREAFSTLTSEFQLHLIDHKLVRNPKLKKIAVDFYHYGEIDVREARLIIHRSANLVLASFNDLYSDQRAYHHYPLTQQDLEISISFVDPNTHKMHSHGAISHAALIDGRIHYSKFVENEERHETVLQESFVSIPRD